MSEFAKAFLSALAIFLSALGVFVMNHTPRNATAQEKGDQIGEKEPFWEKATNDPVAFFTLALVVATGGLAVATFSLARSTRIAANAAKRSAEALPIVERAYVFFRVLRDNFDDSIFSLNARQAVLAGSPEKRLVKIQLSNWGKTPAVILEIRMGLFHTVGTPADDHYMSFTPDSLREPVIPQNVEFPMDPTDDGQLTAAELLELQQGHRTYFLQGSALYRAVTDEDTAPDRHTTFCWRLDFSTKVWAEWGGPRYNRRN